MGKGKENSGSIKTAFETLVGCAQIIGTVIGVIALIVAFLGLAWAITHQKEAIQVVRVISGEPTAIPTPKTNTPLPSLSATATSLPASTPTSTTTPTPTDTPLPTNTPTDTAPLTDTPTPTNTPAPTSPPDPISVSGLVIIRQEDFSDPQSGWERSWDQDVQYKNGEMVLKHDTGFLPETFMYARPNLNFDSFILEVDARWSGGAVGGTCGVLFRYQDRENYYAFYIGNDGRYTIGKRANGKWSAFLEEFSDAIDRQGGTNRFHIEANEHDLCFFINGQFLGSVHDVDHDLGDVLLIAQRPKGAEFFEASFDNVIVAKHP